MKNIVAPVKGEFLMDLHISDEHVFFACGYTDIHQSIDGLSAVVTESFPAFNFLWTLTRAFQGSALVGRRFFVFL